MFTDNVQRWAFDRGLYHAVVWFEKCKDARLSCSKLYGMAMTLYEKDHGPRDKWITDEFHEKFVGKELELRERELERQLDEIRRRRSQAK